MADKDKSVVNASLLLTCNFYDTYQSENALYHLFKKNDDFAPIIRGYLPRPPFWHIHDSFLKEQNLSVILLVRFYQLVVSFIYQIYVQSV